MQLPLNFKTQFQHLIFVFFFIFSIVCFYFLASVQECELRNVSVCAATKNENEFNVLIWNSLGQRRTEWVEVNNIRWSIFFFQLENFPNSSGRQNAKKKNNKNN